MATWNPFDGDAEVRETLGDYSDIALAALVVGIIGMMIIPLPTPVIDILLTLNITVAVTLLMVSLYIPRALEIAAFPSILLLTTLFRLGLNVSTTRLILLQADAGRVIDSFGNFVVQGNYVVGAVIFLIITIIQFIVIAKGAERVSEVAARFTLDALPGKQMSIDADLRAGAIDLQEAQKERSEVQRESQLFGSMDGAMKFVKGDAIAGIIITTINIIAGLIIGIVQMEMTAAEAASTYVLLTIGDGLVSQIPALLVSVTAGIIVTRVSSEIEDAHLGKDIFTQIVDHPKAIAIAAGLLAALAVVPGLPTAPFLVMSGAVGFFAYGLFRSMGRPSEALSEREAEEVEQVEEEAREGAEQAQAMIPAVTPLTVEIGAALTEEMDEEREEWLREMIPSMREGLFYELGVKVPAVRMRTGSEGVGERAFAVNIDEVPVDSGEFPEGAILVDESPRGLEIFEVDGEAARHPVSREEAAWVEAGHEEMLEEAGYQTWDAAGYILLRLTAALRNNAEDFVTIQQVQGMLDQLEGPYPALVQEVVPKLVGRAELTEILRRLADEGISLRNLPKILQILADRAQSIKDPAELTEEVRAGLSRYITDKYAGPDGSVVVYVVDREVEETVEGAIRSGEEGDFLALPPDVSREILEAIGGEIDRDLEAGRTPILLTNSEVRRYVSKLASLETDDCTVLAYQELEPAAQVQPLGKITVGD